MHDTKTVHSIHSMLPLIIVNGADSMRIVAIVSLLWASTALAQPEIEGSQVFILSPESLAGYYDHRSALFGPPPYGASIQGPLYYAGSTLCEEPAEQNTFNLDGGYILIVDRGECTFVRKVRIAQNMNALAVVVADNTCLCSSFECVDQNPDLETCETQGPILADDGSGGDITIPSVLIFKQDVDPIIKAVLGGENVQLELSWTPRPQVENFVNVELFSLPFQDEFFLTEFRDVVLALGGSVVFTPHSYIYDGIAANCYHGGTGENVCYNLCTNNGRYCATDPDNDLNVGISGADIVEEALRRQCIWSIYKELDNDGCGEVWWNYIHHFNRMCVNNDGSFANSRCVRIAFRHACVDETLVWKCMKASGGLEGDVENSFLEEAIAVQNELGVVILPSVFVHGTAYTSGQVTALNIFRAICGMFSNVTDPSVCELCANPRCGDPLACVSTGLCSSVAK